ncbi:2740_t:CDS:2 [Cetraspora pellucida]|uniref:2740_t:CDS:1 n=1 Tax=Cetraspora pellucida TaxID=1433469 RepID=A0A9N9PCK2_9GLOM|nr:2740_t:CDS:2 [Cetraspora pellucida]
MFVKSGSLTTDDEYHPQTLHTEIDSHDESDEGSIHFKSSHGDGDNEQEHEAVNDKEVVNKHGWKKAREGHKYSDGKFFAYKNGHDSEVTNGLKTSGTNVNIKALASETTGSDDSGLSVSFKKSSYKSTHKSFYSHKLVSHEELCSDDKWYNKYAKDNEDGKDLNFRYHHTEDWWNNWWKIDG